MLRKSLPLIVFGFVAIQALSGQTCEPAWSGAFYYDGPQSYSNHGDLVEAMVTFDDGSGPVLIAAGDFQFVNGRASRGIAKWDGERWEAFGAGVGGNVYAIAVLDTGQGPSLYIGGKFDSVDGVSAKNIARWDGSRWYSLGSGIYYTAASNSDVKTMTVATIAGKTALYVGGRFDRAGGVAATGAARWDGGSWESLGLDTTRSVRSMTTHTVGGVDRVVAIGQLTLNYQVDWLASFNGLGWTQLGFPHGGSNFAWVIESLAIGTGEPELYLGLTGNDTDEILYRTTNGVWSRDATVYGTGNRAEVFSMEVHDDGSGPALYVSGVFDKPFKNIIRQENGTGAWQSVGAAPVVTQPRKLFSHKSANGATLFTGGHFSNSSTYRGEPILAWDGQSWGDLSRSNAPQTRLDIETYDDGNGPAVYFPIDGYLGEREYKGLAKWDGAAWQSVADTQGSFSLETCKTASGDRLIAYGAFRNPGDPSDMFVGVWENGRWVPMCDQPLPMSVEAVALYDDGTGETVYIGGAGYDPNTGVPFARLYRWSGAAWVDVGEQPGGDTISSLAVADVGNGSQLFAGGFFWEIGGVRTRHVAAYSSGRWSALSGGSIPTGSNSVSAIAVGSNGQHDVLYIGGKFPTPGNNIVMWDGIAWNAMGSGTDDRVRSMVVVPVPGEHEQLYVSGNFLSAGGVPASHQAMWDGSQWHALGEGTEQLWGAEYMTAVNFASGPAVVYSGVFLTAGGQSSHNFAQYDLCPRTCYADCDQSTGVGVIDIFDFLCFQNSFVSGTTYACDCNVSTGNGVCDIFDFLCYQNAFVAGCP